MLPIALLVLLGGLMSFRRPRSTSLFARDGLAVHTAQLTLAGGYAPLLRVVGELERTLPRCRLRSLGWQSSADRRTRCLQLTLTLYIQQVVLKK